MSTLSFLYFVIYSCMQYDGALSIRDRSGGLVMQSQPPGGEGPYALALSDNGDLVLINGAPGGGEDVTLQV